MLCIYKYIYPPGSGPAMLLARNSAGEADIHTSQPRDLRARNFGVVAKSSNELKTLWLLHRGHCASGGYMVCKYGDERVTLNHYTPRMINIQHR